jgi:hypothetical protein
MTPILASVPTLAVACVYCLWSIYRRSLQARERVLRGRLGYMLWVLATETDDVPAPARVQPPEALVR